MGGFLLTPVEQSRAKKAHQSLWKPAEGQSVTSFYI